MNTKSQEIKAFWEDDDDIKYGHPDKCSLNDGMSVVIRLLNYYLLPWEARLVKCGLGWVLRLDAMFGLSLLFIFFSCCKSFSFLSGIFLVSLSLPKPAF